MYILGFTRNLILVVFILAINYKIGFSQTLTDSINTFENEDPIRKLAHPKAKDLLVDEFYWSPIEESGPFGNDAGSDTFYSFKNWRENNKNEPTIVFLNEFIEAWHYPKFDFYEMNNAKIKKYLRTKYKNPLSKPEIEQLKEYAKKMSIDSGKKFDEKEFYKMIDNVGSGMGINFLTDIDNAIIAIGYGQFVLEGKVDIESKKLMNIAIERELLPLLLNQWDNPYRKERKEQLLKMRSNIDKM